MFVPYMTQMLLSYTVLEVAFPQVPLRNKPNKHSSAYIQNQKSIHREVFHTSKPCRILPWLFCRTIYLT